MAEEDLSKQRIDKYQEEQVKSKSRIFRVIAIFVFVLVTIGLIVLKINKPTFPLWIILLIAFLAIALLLASFFGISIYNRFKDKKDQEAEKLPKAITEEQARELRDKMLMTKDRLDYVEEVFDTGVKAVGREGFKTLVYWCIYRPSFDKNSVYFFGLNMHQPKQIPRSKRLGSLGAEKEITTQVLNTLLNDLAIDPAEAPRRTTIEKENSIAGIKEKTTVEEPVSKDKKDETKKEGSLE